MERGKLARIGRTLQLARELPSSYLTVSRRERDLLADAAAFITAFQACRHSNHDDPALTIKPCALAALYCVVTNLLANLYFAPQNETTHEAGCHQMLAGTA